MNVRGSFSHKNDMVAPLALTIFAWVFLMNLMDLVPVDLIPHLFAQLFATLGADPHHVYLKVVPVLAAAGARDFFVAHWSEVPAVLDHVPAAQVAVLHGPLTEADCAFARARG